MFAEMKIWLVVFSVVVAIGSVPDVCGAVSFDCSKAQNFREKAVCSNAELGELDDQLSAAYKVAQSTWGNTQGLVDSQRQWMKEANRCADEACIAKAYGDRISELDGSDVEEGDTDNVDDTPQAAEGSRQGSGEAESGGIGDILNQINRVGQDAGERPGAVAPYFSTVDEFGSFYAGIEQAERLDGQRLAAGLEILLVASGGQFVADDDRTPDNCRRRLVEYSPQMLLDFIRYKKSEVSHQPPTFFARASEEAATPFSGSLGHLKNYMNQTWREPGCQRNAQLLDPVLKDLSRAADTANETVRASLKAAYAAQLEKDKQLQVEQEAAAEKRAEEQRAEQARQDEERRKEAAARADEQVRIAESQRQVAAQGEAKQPPQAQGASDSADEAPASVNASGVPTELSASSDTDEPERGFFSRLIGGVLGFFAGLFKGLVGFFGSVLFTLVCLTPAFLMVQRVRVELRGYVVDPEKDEFSFPGGLISANSVSDYFKIKFITQAFQHFTIRLTDIQSLSAPTIQTTSISKEGNVSEDYTHLLEIRGTFGAATMRFLSEGKRDQVFAAIRQANQMGTPVFRSN